jgi:hypothetical protein
MDAALSRYIGKWAHYLLFSFGPVSLPLGLTKSVQGQHDEAVALVEGALEDLERTNFMDLHARLRLHFAEVLRRRGAAGDDERARDELVAARARAEAMPAPQLVARIDTLLAAS